MTVDLEELINLDSEADFLDEMVQEFKERKRKRGRVTRRRLSNAGYLADMVRDAHRGPLNPEWPINEALSYEVKPIIDELEEYE